MKHRSITTILSVIAFAIIVITPIKANADANFSCSKVLPSVSGSNYAVALTIDQIGTIQIGSINNIYIAAQPDLNPLLVPTSSHPNSATEIVYYFDKLAPATDYNVYASYVSYANAAGGKQVSEPISNCNFTSSNGTVAGIQSAPATTTTSNTCSPTNVTNDSCYEQYCTGQASEDSQSCGAYATAYAIKDDNGDTSCASINSSNDTTCCDNATDSPMCNAYNDYSAKEAQAQSGTPAAPATPSTISTGSIVSPDGDGLVPCDGNDCTVNSVVQLLDNLMSFFFQTLLLPIFVVMVMYLGYSYLTANGKPGQHAKVISMAQHMVGGLVLMLCAWLIVHTILSILGYTDTLGFFGS